jgi:hypothetical protein
MRSPCVISRPTLQRCCAMARLSLMPPPESARPAIAAKASPSVARSDLMPSSCQKSPHSHVYACLERPHRGGALSASFSVCFDVGEATRYLGRPRITRPRRQRMDRRRATRLHESLDGVTHQLRTTSWTSAALIEQCPRPPDRPTVCPCCSRPSLDDGKSAEAELEDHNSLLPQDCTGLRSQPCTAARSSLSVRCAQTPASVRTWAARSLWPEQQRAAPASRSADCPPGISGSER